MKLLHKVTAPLKNVVPIRPQNDDPQIRHLDLMEGVESKIHSPLIQHLAKIADQAEIQEVIELLRDIRLHQDHPDMVGAFRENSHNLAHKAKDHQKNILELLVEDYLSHNKLDPEKELDEAHKFELELHVQHIAMNTLKGYQEVVEGIRMDVTGLADELDADESIDHVRDLIDSIHGLKSNSMIMEGVRISPSRSIKEILRNEPDLAHQALAKIAFEKGHRSAEDAVAYIRDELHQELQEHFGGALKLTEHAERNTSGIFLSDLAMERIKREREENPRVDAAFSLMEALKSKLGSEVDEHLKRLLGSESGLPANVLTALSNQSEDNVERALGIKATSIASDLAELDYRLETLAGLYVQALCEGDFKVKKGLEKISQYRNGSSAQKAKIEEVVIPEGGQQLLEVMKSSTDAITSITRLWLKDGPGSIEDLNELVNSISTDAQCYIETEESLSIAPYSRPEGLGAELMLKKVRYPAFDSSADKLLQVLRAASADLSKTPDLEEKVGADPTLQELLRDFDGQEGDMAQGILERFLQLKSEGAEVGTFDDYLDSILKKVQANCDTSLYQRLLRWSERKTIQVAVAPPSAPVPPEIRTFRHTIPIEYMADALKGKPGPRALDLSSLKEVTVPHVFEKERHATEAGTMTKIVYAMQGSIIEVADGSKVDLFMANNNVMIRLMGDNAHVRIQKITQNCKRLQLMGKYGETIIGGDNVELGEGVEKVLAG